MLGLFAGKGGNGLVELTVVGSDFFEIHGSNLGGGILEGGVDELLYFERSFMVISYPKAV
jgi:hypothetical protein